MSDAKQPETMRPIPDGGLKDSMPSWLKRPPAWRNMPTAEERHERALPEPDTSEIDPRTLVDLNDLPQWLQVIAARGDLSVAQPDASIDHAVEVVQSVSMHTSTQAPSSEDQAEGPSTVVDETEVLETTVDDQSDQPIVPKPINSPAAWITRGLIIFAVVLAGVLILLWLNL